MANVSKDLQLIYELANGKNYTLTIPDYKDGITDADGLAVGRASGLVSAVRIDTTKTEVALA